MTLRKNLIYDILDAEKRFSLECGARFFPSIEMKPQDVATCFALGKLLNEIHGDNKQNVFIAPKNRWRLTEEEKEMCNAEIEENNFLSVVVGTSDIAFAESPLSRHTFVVFNVDNKKERGTGVRNYINSAASCTAEIVAKDLMEYCKKEKTKVSPEVMNYLYEGIVFGTNGIRRSINPGTLQAMKWLVEHGANYVTAMEAFYTLPADVAACENIIFNNAEVDDNLPFAWIEINDSVKDGKKYDIKTYIHALDHFRNLENIEVWLLVMDKGYMNDAVFISKDSSDINVAKFAIKKNGTGTAHDANAKIVDFDMKKLIPDFREFVKESINKRKGKKD